MSLTEFTSTSFGLTIAFVLPGATAVYSMSYWFESARHAFRTFLTSNSNLGLFLLILIAAMTFGLVISAVRWLIYEVLVGMGPIGRLKAYGDTLPETWRKKAMAAGLESFRASVDELYRYHQFFGGMTVALPALFVGWLNTLQVGHYSRIGLVLSFIALETLLLVAAIAALRRQRDYMRGLA